uniref:Uncharacterized protein n=1 Tax=viral metagenome TaxID=1070528 RepID=A0A6C0B4K4_9ZZZZ
MSTVSYNFRVLVCTKAAFAFNISARFSINADFFVISLLNNKGK